MTPGAIYWPVAAAFTAAVLALVLTEACRRIALRYGVTDRPGAYKLHARPTPYLGGVALVVSTLVPMLAAAAVRGRPDGMLLLAVAALLVAAIGLADDILPMGLVSRLGIETTAAALVVLGGLRLDVTGHPWPDAALTIVWIVLLTNSFNLLDNMDAAAASVAGATAAVLGVAALLSGNGVALPLLCLAGSCAGFLFHNRPPARIFMGDAGSLFLGFVVAVGAVAFAPPGPLPAFTVLLLIGFAALVDTALVVVSRHRVKRAWHQGGTDHISHRLRRLGLPTSWVAGGFALAGALSAALGVLVAHGFGGARLGLAAPVAGAVAVLLLLRIPGYPDPVRRASVDSIPGRGG